MLKKVSSVPNILMPNKTRYNWENNIAYEVWKPKHSTKPRKWCWNNLFVHLQYHAWAIIWNMGSKTRPTAKRPTLVQYTVYNIQATSSYTGYYSKIESHNKVQTSKCWTTCFRKRPWVLNRHSWTCYLGPWATGHTKQTFLRIDDTIIKWSACTNTTSHLWFDYLLQLSLLTSVQRDSLGIGNWNYC